MDQRKLTQDEIDEIAKCVATQLRNDLYQNVGSGIMALAWKGILLIIIILASYGVGKHFL